MCCEDTKESGQTQDFTNKMNVVAICKCNTVTHMVDKKNKAIRETAGRHGIVEGVLDIGNHPNKSGIVVGNDSDSETARSVSWTRAESTTFYVRSRLVQFSSVQSLQYFSEEKSVKGQSEKMSLEPCSKLTATDGRGAKVKRQ